MNTTLLNEISKYENIIDNYLHNYDYANVIRTNISNDVHYIIHTNPFWNLIIGLKDNNQIINFDYFISQSKEECIQRFNQIQNKHKTKTFTATYYHNLARITHHLYNIGYFLNKENHQFNLLLTIPVDEDQSVTCRLFPLQVINYYIENKTYMKYDEFLKWEEASHENFKN